MNAVLPKQLEKQALALVSYVRELHRDSPAKVWWDCPARHASVARALHIDPTQAYATYALAPFRYHRDGEAHLVLAAWPTPRIVSPLDPDWLGIDTVLAWNPPDNTVWVLGDKEPQFELPTDPRALFQRWAVLRAQWAAKFRIAAQKKQKRPTEPDLFPEALA